MSNSRYTVTAALPYANGPIHIGHLAGAYLPADIFVRFLKLTGKEVLFVCGSDEHGAAITLRAQKEGKSPQEIVDHYHAVNEQAFHEMGIDFDIYHRTSAPLHHQTAQDFFLKLSESNAFEIKESEQLFDETFQQFLADRYIMGTCPKCGHTDAYGDQCEKCGATLNPTDLLEPRSVLSGNKPIWKKTKHWYLPLERHQEWLTEWISTGDFTGRTAPVTSINPANWKSNVKGQCLSWLNDGLRARAMTRDLEWGVPVPLADAAGKVLYVWLDAPIGYISATREWAAQQGKDWEPWWKDSSTKLVHFIGKDNIVFHCIIFPVLLKLHGEFILPHNVPANEFLNLEGQKISTSRNHAVWLPEYLKDFPGKRDELRYVLTSIAPETGDSEFTWKDYQTRINSELVAILGNLANRVLVLYHKFFEGVCSSHLSVDDPDLEQAIAQMYLKTEENILNYNFRSAQFHVMELAREGNKYLTRREPWKSFNSNPEDARKTLDSCVVLLAHLAMGMRPFLPDTSDKLYRLLGINAALQKWGDAVHWPSAHKLAPPELLFTKIEDEAIEIQRNKLEQANVTQTMESNTEVKAVAPLKAEISYEQFSAMDLRVGKVISAEPVPKTDKLIHLTVDLGFETRSIVSGIAQYFNAADLPGRQVVVLANLAPRKMRGIESAGMILLAEDADGKLIFVAPDSEVQPGSVIA